MTRNSFGTDFGAPRLLYEFLRSMVQVSSHPIGQVSKIHVLGEALEFNFERIQKFRYILAIIIRVERRCETFELSPSPFLNRSCTYIIS